MSKEVSKPCCGKYATLYNKDAMKSYGATFGAGYVSGIAGEIYTLAAANKLNAENVTNPNFRDLCFISGVQQVAKEFSKNTLKTIPAMKDLARENPFLFGAATGFPMWFLTRAVATPIQNSRKKEPKPYKGFAQSVAADTAYHTIKNGLDEFCAQRINPLVVPRVDGFVTKRFVEGVISGVVGGGCYLLAWPIKTRVTGQTLPAAWDLCVAQAPKVFVKKVSYTVARPHIANLLK